MYTQHWGLTKSPFAGSPRGTLFYGASGQNEAIARIDYLVKNRRRFGVLMGEAGLGKSAVLDHVAQQANRSAHQAIPINLLGMDQAEFMISLAHALGHTHSGPDSPAALWRGISDQLTTSQYQQRATLLLLDNAHDASADVLTAIERLSQWKPSHDTRVTILATSTPNGAGRIGRRLLDLCDLKLELRPWKLDDTIGFVRATIEKLGGSPTLFDNESLDMLQRIADGNPRRIRQLAELALIAGAGQSLRRIDASTLLAVNQELRMPLPPAAA